MSDQLSKLIKANRQHIIDSALKLNDHIVQLFVDEVAKDLGFRYGKPWQEVKIHIEESLINAGAMLPK